MIDARGYIVHIDFGFILTISPGGFNFESAPFKLTKDYIEMMDGVNSMNYYYFEALMTAGFIGLRDHVEEFVSTLEIMKTNSDLPCFAKFSSAIFKERFAARLQCEKVPSSPKEQEVESNLVNLFHLSFLSCISCVSCVSCAIVCHLWI